MKCIRCNIFGHKMVDITNIDTKKITSMCVRCGYREDTSIEDMYELLYSLKEKFESSLGHALDRIKELQECMKEVLSKGVKSEMDRYEYVEFEVLKGKILKKIEVIKDKEKVYDKILFYTIEEDIYEMFHFQDCCENVIIQDIVGEIDNLIGNPILVSDERTNEHEIPNECSHWTWTFYELATIQGSVSIRWYGGSNGYYSERVSFRKIGFSETEEIPEELDENNKVF